MTSIAFLIVGFVLFLIAAVSYAVTAVYLLTHPGESVPHFTLTEIGNISGVSGMLVIPVFIVTAMIQNFRVKRREKNVGNNPKPGATERSRSDRQDS